MQKVPLLIATESSVAPYATLFSDFAAEDVRLVRWPQQSWRPVADGLSGGITTGEFDIEWRNGVLFATNSAVKDGDYRYGWADPAAALVDPDAIRQSKWFAASGLVPAPKPSCPPNPNGKDSKTPATAFCRTEINYHACGSQLFFAPNDPLILLLANPQISHRNPDDLRPSDFVSFYVPKGVGVNLSANVWHAPPMASSESSGPVTVYTKQAAVHSKIYYDPVVEHGVLLAVDTHRGAAR